MMQKINKQIHSIRKKLIKQIRKALVQNNGLIMTHYINLTTNELYDTILTLKASLSPLRDVCVMYIRLEENDKILVTYNNGNDWETTNDLLGVEQLYIIVQWLTNNGFIKE